MKVRLDNKFNNKHKNNLRFAVPNDIQITAVSYKKCTDGPTNKESCNQIICSNI